MCNRQWYRILQEGTFSCGYFNHDGQQYAFWSGVMDAVADACLRFLRN